MAQTFSVLGSGIHSIISLIWTLFFLYWLASIFYETARSKTKETAKSQSFLFSRIQGLFLVVAVALVIVPLGPGFWPLIIRFVPNYAIFQIIGIIIAIAGISFAFWARMHLGSNWSSNVVIKKGHELVKTGPYAIVRHPIYTGITLCMVGSAIAVGEIAGLVAIVSVLIFSWIRISGEERFMKEKFGKEYEKYRRQAKTFIPFIY